MSEAIQCDRCGKMEVKAHVFHTSDATRGIKVSLCGWDKANGSIGYPAYWKPIDLCGGCRASLAGWMVGECQGVG